MPAPDKETYGKLMIAKINSFNRRIRWKIYHIERKKDDVRVIDQYSEMRAKFKSRRSPPFNPALENFEKDLIQSLVEGTSYKDLGVKNELRNEVDPNTDGDDDSISPRDAKAIADALLMDENLSIEYLARYYTNFGEQNWNAGAMQRQGADSNLLNKDEYNSEV